MPEVQDPRGFFASLLDSAANAPVGVRDGKGSDREWPRTQGLSLAHGPRQHRSADVAANGAGHGAHADIAGVERPVRWNDLSSWGAQPAEPPGAGHHGWPRGVYTEPERWAFV